MDILFLFSISRPQLGITEISDLLKLTKPTVHGLVRTLTDRGFLHQDPVTRKYSLGLKIFELGNFLAGSLKINQMAMGTACKLAEKTQQMTRIAIWDQNAVLVTMNIMPGLKAVQGEQLGPRVPAYCSAAGKAILATFPQKTLQQYISQTEFIAFTPKTIIDKKHLLSELEAVRAKGYAQDIEEFMPGLGCLSAPIYDHTGCAVAAISLSALPQLLFGEQHNAFTDAMRQSAEEISGKMGFLNEPL